MTAALAQDKAKDGKKEGTEQSVADGTVHAELPSVLNDSLSGATMPSAHQSSSPAASSARDTHEKITASAAEGRSKSCTIKVDGEKSGRLQISFSADGAPIEVKIISSTISAHNITTTYKIDGTLLNAAERASLLDVIKKDISQTGGIHIAVDRLERISHSAEVRKIKVDSKENGEPSDLLKQQMQLKAALPENITVAPFSAAKDARTFTLEALQGRQTIGVFKREGQELEIQKGPGKKYFCTLRQGASEFTYRLNLDPELATEKLNHFVAIFAEDKVRPDPSKSLVSGKLGQILAFDSSASIAGGKGLHLKNTNFIGRDMRKAEFESCVFEKCFATRARAQGMRATACTFVDLRADNSNFLNAAFIRCDFVGHTIFFNSKLAGTNWSDSSLKESATGSPAIMDARNAHATEMEIASIEPKGWKGWLSRKIAGIPVCGKIVSNFFGWSERKRLEAVGMTKQMKGLVYSEGCANFKHEPSLLAECSSVVKGDTFLNSLDDALRLPYASLAGKLSASGVLKVRSGGPISLEEDPERNGFTLRDKANGVFAKVEKLDGRTDKGRLTLYHVPNNGDAATLEVAMEKGQPQTAKMTFDQILAALTHYCNGGHLHLVRREVTRPRVMQLEN